MDFFIQHRNTLCIYTTDGVTATYETVDITYFTCEEVLNSLQQYATQEWVENYVDLSNYYNKEEVDYLINNIHQGEDCLFTTSGTEHPQST
jgi:hypothetical protein